MDYKLYRNKNELNGTCYFEFLPGKYQNKCWNDNSVFLSEDSVYLFEDLLKKVNNKYDHYAFIGYNKNQISMLINELSKRLYEIENINNYELVGTFFRKEYYSELNENLRRNKNEIKIMLQDLIDWLKTININEITILGI